MRRWIKKKVDKLTMPKHDGVVILGEVADDIRGIAKNSYPNEFVALLGGEVKGRNLVIAGLIYQVFHPSRMSAFMHINLPMISGVVGSVHSHPTPGNSPSKADLLLFNKQGHVHLIVCYPFRRKDIAAYDSYGKRIRFAVS